MEENVVNRIAKIVPGLLALLWLGMSPAMAGSVGYSSKLHEDEGLVVYRYYLNKYLDPGYYTFLNLGFVSANQKSGGETPDTHWATYQAAYSQLTDVSNIYMISLKAGRYHVLRDRNKKTRLGTIEVKAGQVTDLGTFVTHPVFNKASRKWGALTRVTDSRAGALNRALAINTPKIFKQVDGKPVLGWGETMERLLDPVTVDKIAHRPALINNLHASFGGALVGGDNLGQVVERTADGTWKRYDTRRLASLIYATKLDASTYIVGGEEGLLLRSIDSGKTWTTLPAPDDHSMIYFVDRGADGALYLAAKFVKRGLLGIGGSKLKVYRAPDPAQPKWTEIGQYDFWQNNYAGQDNRTYYHVNICMTPERLVLLSRTSVLASYDFKAGTWTDTTLTTKSGEAAKRDVAGNYDIELLDLQGTTGSMLYGKVPSGILVTNDYGKTIHIAKMGTISHPLFINENEGYVFQRNKKLFPDDRHWGLRRFDKQGDSFSDEKLDASPMILANSFHASPDGKQLLIVTSFGFILGSTDNGKHWTPVKFETDKKSGKKK